MLKSQHRDEQLPFSHSLKQKEQQERLYSLKATHSLPIPKLEPVLSSKPLKGFVRPLKGAVEYGSLPEKRKDEGFDPNAYKLLAKADYDFSNPSRDYCRYLILSCSVLPSASLRLNCTLGM